MANACVMVVEDEAELRHLVRLYLEKDGCRVIEAATGTEALERFESTAVDVAVVDVMLPEINGLEVVRRLRGRSHLPIILLTARGEEASRVAGLEVGADDYVVKPFSMLELAARVRAQMRRIGEFSGPVGGGARDEVGRVRIDRDARRCHLSDRVVPLTRREFDLLATLFDHAGHAVSREFLLSEAWGTTFLSHKTVDVHIAALRRKLGSAVRITSLRGIGYRLES
ncbi:MAG: response regulator transcription factor [Candidatus Limnocylindria bacterium]|jgi:DNA-binding response OmpR family regulator